ncbi:MAG: CD225/dispanin family protein [Capnocytophaga sp.]|nr:CD225/dispanin family protein [Capnocytophaga sp.]
METTKPIGPNPANGLTPPDNYLVWAILSTVLCCLPLGIYSIVKASEVNSKWTVGDREGAIKSAETAKKFAIYSAIAAVAVWILYIAFIVIFTVLNNV